MAQFVTQFFMSVPSFLSIFILEDPLIQSTDDQDTTEVFIRQILKGYRDM